VVPTYPLVSQHQAMIQDREGSLRRLVEELLNALRQRAAMSARSEAAKARAVRLLQHVEGYLLVRAKSLETPLVVSLVGPTGAGKSSLFNTIAGRAASPTSVLRPTTRRAVALVHPGDREALLEGPFAAVDPERLELILDPGAAPGVVIVDAPDLDSIERANREVSDHLIEASDLAVFVTTATRYADRVPWAVLARVRERELSTVIVVNRMPSEPEARQMVVAALGRLLEEAGVRRQVDGVGSTVEIIDVVEGALDKSTESLDAASVRPLLELVARLRGDREARWRLAARSLAGALVGVVPLIDEVAADLDHEAVDVEALRRLARNRFDSELRSLREALAAGSFLREEALRQWQDYVGADEITRLFSRGLVRVRATIGALLRPVHAPNEVVRHETLEDVVSVALLHAAEAARKVAAEWAEARLVEGRIEDDATLWVPTEDFEGRMRARLREWVAAIAEDISRTGQSKALLARGGSIGVNALGTGVMLATFIHTGGLTGAEIGVAAGTAFVNQKLLAALFGEAAMVELVQRAATRLDAVLALTFDEERDRFERRLPAEDSLPDLSERLRTIRDQIGLLGPTLGSEIGAAFASDAATAGPTS
jgi:hypothetical protein